MFPCEGEEQRPGLRCRDTSSSHCLRGGRVLIRGQNHLASETGNSPNDIQRWPGSLLGDREVQFKPLPEVSFFPSLSNKQKVDSNDNSTVEMGAVCL